MKDIFMGLLVVLIVVIMWSWASNIGPSWLLSSEHDTIDCDTDIDCMQKNPQLGDY